MVPHEDLLQAFRRLDDHGTGALVRTSEREGRLGAILVESGRVCWARSARQRGRMTDLLLAESDNKLSRDALEEVVRVCRDRSEPLGERLVRERLVSEATMRAALLRHTCEAIRDIISLSASWDWVEHNGLGYSPSLTFSPAEVFSGVHAIEAPGVVAELSARLRAPLLRGQRAFAVTHDGVDETPYAQVCCDDLGVDVLVDLVAQARELMALGSLATANGVVAELSRFACAVWREGKFLHVILDAEELAFSRLVAQLASINPKK